MGHDKRRGPFAYVVVVSMSQPSWAEKFAEGQRACCRASSAVRAGAWSGRGVHSTFWICLHRGCSTVLSIVVQMFGARDLLGRVLINAQTLEGPLWQTGHIVLIPSFSAFDPKRTFDGFPTRTRSSAATLVACVPSWLRAPTRWNCTRHWVLVGLRRSGAPFA